MVDKESEAKQEKPKQKEAKPAAPVSQAADTGKEAAKKPVAKPSAKGIVKKRWVTIFAPKMFNEQPIGESYLADPEKAVGRNVEVSMMTLTGEPQKQSINLMFKINRREGEKLFTELIGYTISPSAIRKMGRGGKERIEESVLVRTADGKTMRIKPMLTTRGRTKGGVLASIRKTIRSVLPAITSKMTLEELFMNIINYKIQRAIAESVRKTYPVANSDIKWAL